MKESASGIPCTVTVAWHRSLSLREQVPDHFCIGGLQAVWVPEWACYYSGLGRLVLWPKDQGTVLVLQDVSLILREQLVRPHNYCWLDVTLGCCKRTGQRCVSPKWCMLRHICLSGSRLGAAGERSGLEGICTSIQPEQIDSSGWPNILKLLLLKLNQNAHIVTALFIFRAYAKSSVVQFGIVIDFQAHKKKIPVTGSSLAISCFFLQHKDHRGTKASATL